MNSNARFKEITYDNLRQAEQIANWEEIKEKTGIELNISEELFLSGYISCFREARKNDDTFDPFNDGRYWFMRHFFGLDEEELGSIPHQTIENGKVIWRCYGMDLWGNPKFIQYCKRNVNKWRRERELI